MSVRPRSLKRTLIVIIVTVSCVSILAALAANMAMDFERIRSELAAKAELNARLAARYCEVPLSFDFPLEAEEVLSGFEVVPEVLNACVFDASGNLFAAYHRSPEDIITFPDTISSTGFRDGALHVFHRIEDGDQLYGTLYLRVSTAPVRTKIYRQLLLMCCLLAGSMILAWGLASRLQRRVSLPLLRLAGVASEIAEHGDYSIRAKTARRDEIGILYTRFNELCEQVEEREKERSAAEEELRSYQSHLEDIVTRRTAELEKMSDDLRTALADAKTASKAKSDFLANMSHEIRTPLGAILGFAQLLQQDASLNTEQRDWVDTINRSGSHLLGLINEILEISKIEAGRSTLNTTDLDFNQLISDIAMMFEMKTSEKGLSLEVEYEESTPRRIIGDEGKLRQILINLIGNAVKFTDQGKIHLRASLASRDDQVWLIVAVTDTGVGIPAEELEIIFDDFGQSTAGVFGKGGSGLGLTISRNYARLMGGDITVDSTPGTGSQFRLEIPCTPSDRQQLPSLRPTTTLHSTDIEAPTAHILIVDDQEDNRKLLRSVLREAGFTTEEAADGRQAVAAFKASNAKTILMDVTMPVMNGCEAAAKIRDLAGDDQPTIIAVTASVFDDQIDGFDDGQFDGTIHKPFLVADLLDAITTLAHSDPGAGAASADPSDRLAELATEVPEPLANNLRKAAAGGYVEQLSELIDETAQSSPELAEGLRLLINDFEYETILRVFDDHA